MTTALQNRLKIKTSDFASKLSPSINKAPSGRSALRGARTELLPIECHVLTLLADGLSSQAIADHVELEADMAITYFKYMLALAGVNSRAGLIAWVKIDLIAPLEISTKAAVIENYAKIDRGIPGRETSLNELPNLLRLDLGLDPIFGDDYIRGDDRDDSWKSNQKRS